MEKKLYPFHLAFPITDIEATRKFYSEVLGCPIGRSAERWIDFNLFGHQLSAHLSAQQPKALVHSTVDGKQVPIPHFGVVLNWEDWHQLADRLRGHNIQFVIEPYIRFQGLKGEQATMFFHDPSGNALEFKSFKDEEGLFES